MGGKKQRVAGNAKPTSSGRIGQIVGNTSNSMLTFSSLVPSEEELEQQRQQELQKQREQQQLEQQQQEQRLQRQQKYLHNEQQLQQQTVKPLSEVGNKLSDDKTQIQDSGKHKLDQDESIKSDTENSRAASNSSDKTQSMASPIRGENHETLRNLIVEIAPNVDLIQDFINAFQEIFNFDDPSTVIDGMSFVKSIMPTKYDFTRLFEKCSDFSRIITSFGYSPLSFEFKTKPSKLSIEEAREDMINLRFNVELTLEIFNLTKYQPKLDFTLHLHTAYRIIQMACVNDILNEDIDLSNMQMHLETMSKRFDPKLYYESLFKISLDRGFPYAKLFELLIAHNRHLVNMHNLYRSILYFDLDDSDAIVKRLILIMTCRNEEDDIIDCLKTLIRHLAISEIKSTNAPHLVMFSRLISAVDGDEDILDMAYPTITKIRKSIPAKSLFNTTIDKNMNIDTVQFFLAILDFYESLTDCFGKFLSIEDFDYIFSLIDRHLQFVPEDLDDYNVALVYYGIVELVHSIIIVVKDFESLSIRDKDTDSLYSKIASDWKNFHDTRAHQNLIKLFIKLSNRTDISYYASKVRNSVCDVILSLDKIESIPKEVSYQGEDIPSHIYLVKLLTGKDRCLIVTSHTILRKIIHQVSKEFESTLELDAIDDDSPETKIDSNLPDFLTESMNDLDDMSRVVYEETRGKPLGAVDEYTPFYTRILTYILYWDIIVGFLDGLSEDYRKRVVTNLYNLNLWKNVLNFLFLLIPSVDNKTHYRDTWLDQLDSIPDFLTNYLNVSTYAYSDEIELAALHLYYDIATKYSVILRRWFTFCNRRQANIVKQTTMKYISSVACGAEFDKIKLKCEEMKKKNLNIILRPRAKEIVASYNVDEFQIDITLKMDEEYPLSQVKIEHGKLAGISETQWRHWLMRLTTFINQRDGNIIQGIENWKRGLDKKFDGLDDCMICFSLVDNYRKLPKHSCKNCKKKVHSSCLFEWFRTSGNSTCPICRGLW